MKLTFALVVSVVLVMVPENHLENREARNLGDLRLSTQLNTGDIMRALK